MDFGAAGARPERIGIAARRNQAYHQAHRGQSHRRGECRTPQHPHAADTIRQNVAVPPHADAIRLPASFCFIPRRMGQRWRYEQQSPLAHPGGSATAAAAAATPPPGRPIPSEDQRSGSQIHPRRRPVVGVDRRLPDPDPAAGLHHPEHRRRRRSLSWAGIGALPLGVAILLARGGRRADHRRRRHRADRSVAPRGQEEPAAAPR